MAQTLAQHVGHINRRIRSMAKSEYQNPQYKYLQKSLENNKWGKQEKDGTWIYTSKGLTDIQKSKLNQSIDWFKSKRTITQEKRYRKETVKSLLNEYGIDKKKQRKMQLSISEVWTVYNRELERSKKEPNFNSDETIAYIFNNANLDKSELEQLLNNREYIDTMADKKKIQLQQERAKRKFKGEIKTKPSIFKKRKRKE